MTNTIPNVPRELLERVTKYCVSAPDAIKARNEVRALLSAPSPAGVDGLEVFITDCATCIDVVPAKTVTDAKVVLAQDATAIIDGLRGEVAQLQSMLATVSKAGIRIRTERDQQAQRIGELEGLLRSCLPALSDGGCAALANRIDAAISAGKEGGVMVFHRFGRIMYSNCALRTDFRFNRGVARHMFWRFWILTGGDK